MVDMDNRYLAALLCMYSLFEFLIKPVYLSSSRLPGMNFWRAAAQAGILLVILSAGSSGFLSLEIGLGYVVIAALYCINELMAGKRSERELKLELESFLFKQLLFGILLFLLWRYTLPIVPHGWYLSVESYVLSDLGKFSDVLRERCAMILAIISAYLFVIDGGTRIVRGILNKFPMLYHSVLKELNKDSGDANEENVGEWIGVLERVLALTFVLMGSFTALAFVLAAKSIARFKKLEEKPFAEYYILGTSASLIVALFAGMVVKIIFGF